METNLRVSGITEGTGQCPPNTVVTDKKGFIHYKVFGETKEDVLRKCNMIKASPLLLEALQEMIRMYEDIEPAGGWQGVYDEARHAVSEATKYIDIS